MEYSQKDKTLAIEVIKRHRGVIGKETVADIQALLSAPDLNKSTVFRWWRDRDKLQANGATAAQPKKRKASSATAETLLQPLQLGATVFNQEDVDKTLTHYFAETAINYLKHANTEAVIADMKGKDAVTAAAIAVDKMRLLLNLPTEIIEILPDVLESIKKTGRNPYDVLGRLKEKLDAEYQH